MRRFVTTAAVLAGVAGFAVSAQAFTAPAAPQTPLNPVIKVSDGHYSCEWFTIMTCSKSYNGAKKGANKYGGYVIDTDDIERFRGGYYCSVKGPYSSKSKARSKRNQARRAGAKSAYIKKGCGVNL